MRNSYEELLLSTAEDGASTSAGTFSSRCATEEEALMDAWMRERHENIENRMFLERARRVLGRILSDGQLTSETVRQARQLMQALKATLCDDLDN